MDMQTIPRPLRKFVESFFTHGFDEYFACPQLFGSTAGPNGGMAGQTCCVFTVHYFTGHTSEGPTLLMVCGKKYRTVKPAGINTWGEKVRLGRIGLPAWIGSGTLLPAELITQIEGVE